MERIPRVNINSGGRIPIVDRIPAPITNVTPPPIVRGLEVPTINLPNVVIPYPTIDITTRQEWRGQMTPIPTQQPVSPPEDTRTLPPAPKPPAPKPQPAPAQIPIREVPTPEPEPDFTIAGVDVNIPEATILVSAAATAVVVTAASLGATVGFNALKGVATSRFKKKRVNTKGDKKVKIKRVKSVLHYIPSPDGDGARIFRYSSEGVCLVDTTTNVENYIRNQVDQNVLYELDNTVIIDSSLQKQFTKEGSDRFKLLFLDPQKFVKKLTAKISL